MKQLFILLLFVFLGVSKVNAQTWQTTGTAGFSAAQAAFTSLAFNGSTPYVAYEDGGNSAKTTVMKFDGTNWVTVGAAGFSAGQAIYISLAFNGSTPYVAYQDAGNNSKATVMKFDGTNWVTVGTAGFSAGQANYTSLAFNGGTPYVAYAEASFGSKVSVKKFDGTNWVTVGAAGFSAAASSYTSLAFNGSTPYVVYEDGGNSNKATVMKFDGTNWVTVGAAGFSAGTVLYTSLAFNSTTPYVAYEDVYNSGKATVKQFDGTNWVTVGATGFSAGMAFYQSLAFNGSTPYVAYIDHANSNKATVMKYDGTNWVTVGATGFSAAASGYTSLVFNGNSTPYVAFMDGGNIYKATVMQFGMPCTTTSSTFITSACNSYTWAAKNNTVYTSSNNSDTIHLTNAGGCDSIVTLNLTINQPSTSTTNTSICASALPYTWNGLTFNAAGSQTYHNNNAVGCDSAATLNLSVNPLPTINAGADKLICPGTSTSLTATGAVSYSWSGGITNGTSFSPSATTTYVVTGTDANNCTNTDTVVVTIRDFNVASITTAICKGVSDTLTAPSGSSYQWKKNGAAIAGKTTRYLYVTVAGSYTVTYTDSLCGVKTSPAVVLTLATPPVKPVLATTKAIICPGDTTTLFAVTAAYKFIWLLGSTTTILPGVTSQSYHTATIGSYYIKAVDSFGCRSAVSGAKVIKAGAIPVPVVTIVNGTLGSKKLTCTNSGTYQWRLNGNNIAGATSNKYIATQTGAYSVRLTNSTGCVAISPDTTLTITYTGPKMSQEALAVMNNQEDIIVYPNPSEGIFYIEVSEATKAIVTDLQGRKVLETNDTHQINLKENPSGIYFLQLMNEEGILLKTEKLMKQ